MKDRIWAILASSSWHIIGKCNNIIAPDMSVICGDAEDVETLPSRTIVGLSVLETIPVKRDGFGKVMNAYIY